MVDPAARLRAALTEIRRSYPATLTPVRRAPGTHTTGTTNPPLPIAASTLDVRAQAHERLAYWAQLVIKGRKLQHLPAVDAPTLATFLIVHIDWLATHKWAHHALFELEHSAGKLAEIAADSAPRRFDVGDCPVVDCAGVLRVSLSNSDALLPSEITCTLNTEGHKWSPSQWKYIARAPQHMDEAAAHRLAAAILTPDQR